MSNFKTHSAVIVKLHNRDIKFQKYDDKSHELTDKSNTNKDETNLNKKQFKIVNNLKEVKGILKVPTVKYDEDTIAMGSGLNNPGINICYMNVIVQVLSHTPFLSSALLKSYHTKICKNYEDNIFCVMCIFENYVKKSFMSPKSLNNPFYTIAKKYIYSKFKLNHQDDSFIFLKYFLDSLSKSCYFSCNNSTSVNVNNYTDKINVVNRSDSIKDEPDSTHEKSGDDVIKTESRTRLTNNLNNIIITNDKIMHTFIGYLFGGYFRNVIICNGCGYKSEKVEEFFDLSLETTKSNELISLLNDFVVPEQLDGSNKYFCSKCKSLQNSTKLLSIYKCPQILTIHLKRFNMNVPNVAARIFNTKSSASAVYGMKSGFIKGKFSKLMKRIHFPYNLSISLETKKDQDIWINYEIYAIVCHLGGSLNSGHYVTFIKGKNNFWFLFDDSTVRVVSNEYVKDRENDVYILFYNSVGTSSGVPEADNEGGNVAEIDKLLNEHSHTNKFCSTSPSVDTGRDPNTKSQSDQNEPISGTTSDPDSANFESADATTYGSFSDNDERGDNKLVHVLSEFRGRLTNTFVKFRKFKSYKLLTIKMLSKLQQCLEDREEDEDASGEDSMGDSHTDYTHTDSDPVGSDGDFEEGETNKPKTVKNVENKPNKCSLNSVFEDNEVDVWSDDENMPQIESYKRLYSSLEPELNEPNPEDLEYDKGKTRKFKKKRKNEDFNFVRHHTGVNMAVAQKELFDSNQNVTDNSPKGVGGPSKFKGKRSKRFKKHA